jgi:hypothetical protein
MFNGLILNATEDLQADQVKPLDRIQVCMSAALLALSAALLALSAALLALSAALLALSAAFLAPNVYVYVKNIASYTIRLNRLSCLFLSSRSFNHRIIRFLSIILIHVGVQQEISPGIICSWKSTPLVTITKTVQRNLKCLSYEETPSSNIITKLKINSRTCS